ncbi:Hypp2579 [Branchiostoma lanceolatum]|uniref:Hypp2579 protein n=1 Tax=Branchiostoma lanceolatum TaxID=7740 RepID=A0A8J9ZST8_BRALA|nr:Hypp2579 [Branchiostoma lanceolatum]
MWVLLGGLPKHCLAEGNPPCWPPNDRGGELGITCCGRDSSSHLWTQNTCMESSMGSRSVARALPGWRWVDDMLTSKQLLLLGTEDRTQIRATQDYICDPADRSDAKHGAQI